VRENATSVSILKFEGIYVDIVLLETLQLHAWLCLLLALSTRSEGYGCDARKVRPYRNGKSMLRCVLRNVLVMIKNSERYIDTPPRQEMFMLQRSMYPISWDRSR
jgi:hypothetical protein